MEAEEEEEAPKKRKSDAKADAPAAKKGKSMGVSAELEAEAKKLGLLLKLNALVENPKVTFPPNAMLHKQPWQQDKKSTVVDHPPNVDGTVIRFMKLKILWEAGAVFEFVWF